ncbi:hypothetical protein KDA_10390 [Dictyobacter alpinus]|uniref:Uncharacterized protein n=1 Tax=Dictyobacter alpinus TaxID=2014873 RepID=A0A402B2H5_9CHLR|nr:hypothetical protein KDA_10390 [Dictyobacter alpinus]
MFPASMSADVQAITIKEQVGQKNASNIQLLWRALEKRVKKEDNA